MKNFKLTLCLFLSLSVKLIATPASPYPAVIIQADGSTLNIIQKGDEKIKWAETLDGYTLLKNQNGIYEYATKDHAGNLVPSGIKTSNIETRSSSEVKYLSQTSPKLYFSKQQISLKNQIHKARTAMIQDRQNSSSIKNKSSIQQIKIPIILVSFSDLPCLFTKNDFEQLMNQENYNLNGATGSVTDYFSDNSFGTYKLQADVFGPYTLRFGRAYYGENDSNDFDKHPNLMIEEAIDAAAADGCNFANYDNKKNNSVDVLHIIFAGLGEENQSGGGVTDAIWSHASIISPAKIYNGTTIESYSCSPELDHVDTMTNIGVLVHELGHSLLGLPDLYDSDYEGSGGQAVDLGQFDVMAGGAWNNDGKTPPLHNVWSRTKLAWVKKIILNDSADVCIRTSNVETNGYTYSTQTNGEDFWLENRKLSKWDAYIPGAGLLIYHVDNNNVAWGLNCGNCTPTKRGFYIKQANGGNSSTTSHNAGTSFPGISNKTEFTDLTAPSSLSWAGQATQKPITNIRLSGDTIKFAFNGGAPIIAPPPPPVENNIDIAVLAINKPLSGVLDSFQILSVDVKNTSSFPAKNITLRCELNGKYMFSDTIKKIAANETLTYNFKQYLNLYDTGNYTIKVSCISANDSNSNNNSQEINIHSASQDVGIESLISPLANPFTSKEKVLFMLKNYGQYPTDTFSLVVTLNTMSYVDKVPPIGAGDTVRFEFSRTLNMLANKDYNLTIYTRLPKDTNSNNDTLHTFFPKINTDTTHNEISELLHGLKIYPNPIQNNLFIKSLYPMEYIEILDIRGALRQSRKVQSKEIVLDMGSYPRGNYILRIKSDRGIIARTIVKM